MLSAANLKPHQLEMMAAIHAAHQTNRIAILHGGYGTHKTSTAIITLYRILSDLGRYYRNYRFGVIGKTYKTLARAFLDEWAQQIPSSLWSYNKNDQVLKLHNSNGLEIWLYHTGDTKEGAAAKAAADEKKGHNLSGLYVPQGELVPEPIYREFRGRLRQIPHLVHPSLAKYAPPYRLRVVDCNPASDTNWIWRYYLDPTSKLHRRVIHRSYATTPETSNFTQEEIDEMRAASPGWWVSRMLDAQWGGVEGGQAFVLEPRHFTKQIPASCRFYLGVDWGFKDEQANLLFAIGDGRIHVVDECVSAGLHPDEWIPHVDAMLARARRRVGDFQLSGLLADTNDPFAAQQWQRYYKVNPILFNKERGLGWRRFMVFLHNTAFTLDPAHTTETQRSITQAVWMDKASKRGALADIEPGFDHPLDVVRYICFSHVAPKLPFLPGVLE